MTWIDEQTRKYIRAIVTRHGLEAARMRVRDSIRTTLAHARRTWGRGTSNRAGSAANARRMRRVWREVTGYPA